MQLVRTVHRLHGCFRRGSFAPPTFWHVFWKFSFSWAWLEASFYVIVDVCWRVCFETASHCRFSSFLTLQSYARTFITFGSYNGALQYWFSNIQSLVMIYRCASSFSQHFYRIVVARAILMTFQFTVVTYRVKRFIPIRRFLTLRQTRGLYSWMLIHQCKRHFVSFFCHYRFLR